MLEAAGIASADLVIVATDGDNTNLVVAQVAKLRYEVPKVAVRVQDPARAAFYSDRGFDVVSPTTKAIEALADAGAGRVRAVSFVIVVGGGQVGSSVTRKLLELSHEVVLVEQRRDRYLALDEEFGHRARPATGPSCRCSSTRGSSVRPTSSSPSPGTTRTT